MGIRSGSAVRSDAFTKRPHELLFCPGAERRGMGREVACRRPTRVAPRNRTAAQIRLVTAGADSTQMPAELDRRFSRRWHHAVRFVMLLDLEGRWLELSGGDEHLAERPESRGRNRVVDRRGTNGCRR